MWSQIASHQPPTGGAGHGAAAAHASGTVRGPERISQLYFALPAVLAAAEPDSLKAALDAVWHAVGTYGEHYPELLEEIRSACADQVGEWADVLCCRCSPVTGGFVGGCGQRLSLVSGSTQRSERSEISMRADNSGACLLSSGGLFRHRLPVIFADTVRSCRAWWKSLGTYVS